MIDTPAVGNQSCEVSDVETGIKYHVIGRRQIDGDEWVDLALSAHVQEQRCRSVRLGLFQRLFTSVGGNKEGRGVRGDPGGIGASGDDTRDPVSSSSETLSGAARALVEQWRERRESYAAGGIRSAIQKCADELSALLVQAGAPEEWRTWGVIEIAVRNVNVSSYIEHWEWRALKAEAEVQRLRGEAGAPEDETDA